MSSIKQQVNCQSQPYYYIDKNENSLGATCYQQYNSEKDKNKLNEMNNRINNEVCSKIKRITPENSYFQDCIFNWKDNQYKQNWNNSICQSSSLYLVPYEMSENVYVYETNSMVPGIFSKQCSKFSQTLFTKLTEQQKLAIDVWVSKNLNQPFVTPDIMERIQAYKKLRINEQFQDFQQKDPEYQYKESVGNLYESFKKALPFLIILIISFVSIGFLVSFRKNISKLSDFSKQQSQNGYQ